MWLFCSCIFRMSYMNLREFCVFDFACIFFVCPTWIYENYACVYFALVFFVCSTCIHKQLCVCISYVLHESTRILYVSILHMYFSYVLHESTKLLYVFSSYALHESPTCIHMSLFCMSYMNLRESIIRLFCMCFKLNFVYLTWTQETTKAAWACDRKQ